MATKKKTSAILQMEALSRTTTIITAHINLAKPYSSEVCHKYITIDTAQRIQIPYILTYLIGIFLKLAYVKTFCR